MAKIDIKNTTVTILDGTAPPNSLEVGIGEGNVTYVEHKPREYFPDRGILDEVRNADQVPVDVTLAFKWTYLRGATASGSTPSVEDALKNVGNAADWVSSDTDACRPYAVDIQLLNDPTPVSCGDEEVILLADFRYEDLSHDLRAGTVSVTGKCNVTDAVVTRQSNST